MSRTPQDLDMTPYEGDGLVQPRPSSTAEAEHQKRLEFQVERAARGRTIQVPCDECRAWTPLPDLYRCFLQCGLYLCEDCAVHHWPEAAAKRQHETEAHGPDTEYGPDGAKPPVNTIPTRHEKP